MPILRLFNAPEDAKAAAEELTQFRHGRAAIRMFAQGADEASVEALTKLGLPGDQAQRFVQGVEGGGAVLSVDPPFGVGRQVMDILDKPRPGDTAVEQAVETREPTYDDEVSFGSHDNAAPFSAAMGWRTLSKDPAPFSRWLGLPTLLNKGTTKASTFGVPLLSDEAAPLSAKLGLPVLSSDPAPLSSSLGWRVLLDDPAPLSRLLGLRVLTKDRAER